MTPRELRNIRVFVIEVGWRAAVRADSLPRDMRWWRNLWETR